MHVWLHAEICTISTHKLISIFDVCIIMQTFMLIKYFKEKRSRQCDDLCQSMNMYISANLINAFRLDKIKQLFKGGITRCEAECLPCGLLAKSEAPLFWKDSG